MGNWVATLLGSLCLTGAMVYGVEAQAAKKALLIGIESYPHIPLKALNGPRNDVQKMTQLAKKMWGFEDSEIKALVDAEATREGILAAIKTWLVKGTSSGDEIFLYYSGHGYQTPDLNGDEEDGLDETLVPYDAEFIKATNSFSNMIIDDEVDELLNQVPDRKLVAIFDACHSGTITRGGEDEMATFPEAETYIKRPSAIVPKPTKPLTKDIVLAHRSKESFLPKSPNRVTWTAVAAEQSAMIDREAIKRGEPGGSVFTDRFYRGLVEGAADLDHSGTITNAKMLDYLRKESEAFCGRNTDLCRRGLTPTLEASLTVLAQDARNPRSADRTKTADLASDLLSGTNPGRVQVALSPETSVAVGKPIKMSVTSATEGYLLILDVDPSGQMVQLFPNRYSDRAGKTNHIAKGEHINIPDAYYGFQFIAQEPAGRGAILALVTEDPVNLDDVLTSHKDLRVVENSKDYLNRLAERLRRVWVEGESNRPVRWTFAKVGYEVVSSPIDQDPRMLAGRSTRQASQQP